MRWTIISKRLSFCQLRSMTLYYSEQSQISEVYAEVKLLDSDDVYYEYYTSTASEGELIQIDGSTQIKDLGEIEDYQVRRLHN